MSGVCGRLAPILALADDLTGALETGAKFAAAGLDTTVTTQPTWTAAATAQVIDTETRHLAPEQAATRIAELAAAAHAHSPRLIYKKTDSTLRGNISAELGALVQAFPDSLLIYVPAYPKMGRTVRGGHLLVEGVPVHLTAFARDPLNPIRHSHIPTLLASESIAVHDAETEAEIEQEAASLCQRPGTLLAAGPAAFAQALAARIEAPRGPVPTFPAVHRCLVINGSLHPAAARQVEAMTFDDAWQLFDPSALSGEGTARARALGHAILPRTATVDAVVIFGGDTAFGILEALGGHILRPQGEILPGVPLSLVRTAGRDLILITKAGGFGPAGLLPSLRNLLSNRSQ